MKPMVVHFENVHCIELYNKGFDVISNICAITNYQHVFDACAVD